MERWCHHICLQASACKQFCLPHREPEEGLCLQYECENMWGLFFICVRTDTVTSEHVCVSVCRPNANCKTRTKGSTISL